LFRNVFSSGIVGETAEIFVEHEHSPLAEGAASFGITRWTFAMRTAQNQPLGYTALLGEEVGRMVSDRAEVDEEIHAVCEALITSEGRLRP
jgi:hypothetical protein